ncbi:MAG: STAS domain-containing protein [Armatimonadetes bacterium]|nr:STAS domain-containing protein [Armatimonadota bacterium]
MGNYDIQPLTTETQGSTLLLSGDIDLYVAGAFREVGEAHVRDYAEPVIDLTGVPFLDSAGLASLLSIARVARNHSRTLHVIANGNPRRVLRITGVDQLVSMQE